MKPLIRSKLRFGISYDLVAIDIPCSSIRSHRPFGRVYIMPIYHILDAGKMQETNVNKIGRVDPETKHRNKPDRLKYPYTAPATDGSVVEIRPGILWARLPMPMRLDHINVYLLRDHDGWFLIDTGLHWDESKRLWGVIVRTQLDGMPIKGLICTHFHYDHSGLAQWLTKEFSIPLYMTYGEYYTIRTLSGPISDLGQTNIREFFLSAGLDDETITKIIDKLKTDRFMTSPPASFRRLMDGQILTIGDNDWRVVVGQGHSPEHACLYCEQEEILISGDQLLPRITPNVLVTNIEPEGNPLQLWFDSLDKLDTLAINTLVLPSHQDVFCGLHKRVEELRTHHEKAFNNLRSFLSKTDAADGVDCMRALYKRELKGGELMLGLGEALAHLAWLKATGEVTVTKDATGKNQYCLSSAH